MKHLSDDVMRGLTNVSRTLGRDTKVNVVFEGKHARTDGNTIYLPTLKSGIYLTTKQTRVLRGYADHEAGHIRHTDMKNFQVWAKKNQDKNLLLHLNNALEDVRMENKVMGEYYGSRVNINTVQAKLNKGMLKEISEAPEGKRDQASSIGPRAIICEGHKRRGAEEGCEEVMSYIGENVKAHASNWNDALERCRHSRDVQRLAEIIYEQIKEDEDLKENPQPIPDESFMSDDGSDPHKAEGEAAKGQEEGQGESEGVGEENKTKTGIGESDADVVLGNLSDIVEYEVSDWDGTGDFSQGITPYTTKDDTWHTKNTTNKEVKEGYSYAEKNGMKWYQEGLANSSSTVNSIRSKITRWLKAKEMRDWDCGREIGRLDTKRLVRAYNRAPNVYKVKTDREEINTAISVLIDFSGSMYGDKAQAAKECVIALAEALEPTMFKYNINGFLTGCTESIPPTVPRSEMPINTRMRSVDIISLKSWDERLYEAKPYIGGLKGFIGGANNDPESILWVAEDLKRREEKRKVMLVLSDGEPAFTLANSSNPHNSIRVSTKNAVAKCEKEGIQMIGIGIQSKAVKSFYPNYHIVNDVSDLGSTVMDEILKLT